MHLICIGISGDLAPYNITERMQGSSQNFNPFDSEQTLTELMIRQYYNYISLLKLTNNFERRLSLYEDINMETFQGKIAIIGNITEITHPQQQLKNKYYFPIIQTTVNKSFFQRDEPYSRRMQNPIKRVLAVNKKNYLQIFLLPFNKIISLSKKEKNQFFIFTSLKIYLYKNEIYFCLTQQSSIIQLELPFYQSLFKLIQTSLESTFSEIDLRKVYTDQKLIQYTYTPNDVRSKICENINEMSIMGILTKVNHDSYKNQINQKQKQVQLTILQDAFSKDYTSVGLCRIYVRFDKIDQEKVMSYIQEGYVYIFKISEIFVGQNFQLSFKINRWKDNMIRIAKIPVQSSSFEQRLKSLTISPLKALTLPIIYRNYYKFHVIQVQTKFFHLKVCCQHCENSLMRVGVNEYQCMNQCGVVNGELKLWVIVSCMDNSYNCQLTIEDENVLRFFDIQSQAEKIKEKVLQEEQKKRGLTLYFKRDRQNEDQQFDDAIVHDKNPYLLQLLTRCLLNISEKEVVGVPRSSIFQNYGNQEESFRHEFCNTFVKPKELNKKAKMFLNGQFRPYKQKSRFVPQIKVERVYPYIRANHRNKQK